MVKDLRKKVKKKKKARLKKVRLTAPSHCHVSGNKARKCVMLVTVWCVHPLTRACRSIFKVPCDINHEPCASSCLQRDRCISPLYSHRHATPRATHYHGGAVGGCDCPDVSLHPPSTSHSVHPKLLM